MGLRDALNIEECGLGVYSHADSHDDFTTRFYSN